VTSSAPIDKRQATYHAGLTAAASAICLVLASWWDLKQPNLAVWTTFLVMAQHSYSSFQKGIERIVGRGIGIFLGLVVVTWLANTPLVVLMVVGTLLTAFFYLYFAGRLAYTFLQAGLYLVAVLEIGTAAPTTVVSEAKELFAAIVVGVVVADIVNWLAGSEGDLGLELGNTPLFPIRGEWINQSLMLSVTVLVTLVGAHVIGLPPAQSAISVIVLTVAPHLQALIVKGELRLLGLFLATLWGLATFILVGLLPFFPLLVLLVFFGVFVATYFTITGGPYGYAGLQMGLVVPMLVASPPGEFGSVTPAEQRFEGIVLGLVASIVVAGLWPFFPLSEPTPVSAPPPPPVPAMPGEIDV
jgi:Fusaric acid resistance protein family